MWSRTVKEIAVMASNLYDLQIAKDQSEKVAMAIAIEKAVRLYNLTSDIVAWDVNDKKFVVLD
jgi:hypothetical protein